MRKLITFLCLISACLSASAGNKLEQLPPPLAYFQTKNYPKSFDGFYVGAGMGVVNSSIEGGTENIEAAPASNNTHSITNRNFDTFSNNFALSLYLGYGYSWRRFYLGANLQYTYFYNHLKLLDNEYDIAHIATLTAETQLKQSYQLAINIKPGVYLNSHSLLFLIGGVSIAGVRLNVDSTMSNPSSNLPLLNQPRQEKTTLFGYAVGAGMEQMFAPNWSLSFATTFLVNRNMSHYGVITSGTDNLTVTSAYTNYNDLTLLGVNYYLNKGQDRFKFSNQKRFNGFYFSLAAGANKATANFYSYKNYLLQTNPGGSLIIRTLDGALIGTSPTLNLSLGAGFSINRVYLGLDLSSRLGITQKFRQLFSRFDQFVGGTPLYGITEETHQLLQKPYFTLLLKPGILLSNNNLVYLLGGMAYNQFKYNAEATLGFSGTVNSVTQFHFAQTKNSLGYAVGLGMEHQFSSGFGIFLQEIYRIYPKYTLQELQANVSFIPLLGFAGNDFLSHYRVEEHQFSIGVNYHFL